MVDVKDLGVNCCYERILNFNCLQNLGVSLGYIMRLVELLSFYTGGPLLHCSFFQGSTSSIWQPQTFRHRDPPPLQSKLHLYLPSQAEYLSQSRCVDTFIIVMVTIQ